MASLDRRQLLAVLGASAAGAAGGGYWLRRRSTLDCPTTLEPDREYSDDELIWSRPVADDGTVFVGSGTGIARMSSDRRMFRLFALDTRGEPAWVARRELAGGIGRPRPTDDRVFASTGGNTVFALERETGQFQWEFDAGNNAGGSMSVVTVTHDGTVITAVTSPDHDDLESRFAVLGLSAEEGVLEWTAELDAKVSSGLAVIDGRAVVATQDGDVTGIDPGTGERAWTADLEGAVGWFASPVQFAGLAWIPREDGTLVGLDLETGATTAELASERTGADDDDYTPVVETTDDALFVGDSDGNVTAYDADRSERWTNEGVARVGALDVLEDRVAVLDQRGVYAELDRETGDPYREFALTDAGGDDRCGFDPSQKRIVGLTATRRSILTTGRLFGFGVRRYRLPARKRDP